MARGVTILRTEHEEQCDFVSWFRQAYKGIRIFAIPNGGQRNIATATRLKCEGVSRGVPDLFIPEWGIWIEMKSLKGMLSEDQESWKKYLEDVGYKYIVGYGMADAVRHLKKIIEAKK
jgi:hypothetical protein